MHYSVTSRRQPTRRRPVRTGFSLAELMIAVGILGMGLAMVALPLAYPSPYIFASVWAGFVLLCDPLNYLLGRPSLLGDLAKGRPGRVVSLLIAGGICGFLWEFWNYWATTKWIYTVPFTQNIKIFEMPLLGFVGFFPFAWECFCMYHFLAGKEGFALPPPAPAVLRERVARAGA